MKRFFTTAIFCLFVLLLTLQESPAPIVEEEKPTPAPEQSEAPKRKGSTRPKAPLEEQPSAKIEAHAKPASPLTSQGPARSTPRKQKSVEAFESNSARRFDGIWQGSVTKNSPEFEGIGKFTLTVRGKSAELTADLTGSFLKPRQRIHIKATNHSDHVVADGSDLIIRWRGGQVVDWEPKTYTRKDAEGMAGGQISNQPNVFTLNGDKLVGAGGTIYHRVK